MKSIFKYFLSFYIAILFIGCESTEVRKEFYKSGELRDEYHLKNGELNGAYKTYYKNGVLKAQLNFKNDKPNGLKKFYSKGGFLKSEEQYIDGELNGVVKEYNKNGNVIAKSEFVNGKQDGKTIEYFENGNIKVKSNFTDGIMNGEMTEYFENGEVLMNANYYMDTLLYYMKYSKNGDTVDTYRRIEIKPIDNPTFAGQESSVHIRVYGPKDEGMKYEFYFISDGVKYYLDYKEATSSLIKEQFSSKDDGEVILGVNVQIDGKIYNKEKKINVLDEES